MAYFKVSQSVNKNGPYKWYWYLHEDKGHIFHISDGFINLKDCLQDLDFSGIYWKEQML